MTQYGTDYDQVSLGFIFSEVDAQRGFSIATANPTEWIRNATLINKAGNEIWTKAFWPELMNVEQRTYRVPWDAATNWNVGDEVWREDTATNWRHYCRAVQANNNVDPETDDGTNWLIDPPDFIPYIDFTQPWEDTIIEGVELKKFASYLDTRYVAEPAYLQELEFIRKRVVFPRSERWFDHDTYVAEAASGTTVFPAFINGNPMKPWVRFRPPCPKIGAVVYDPARSYAVGEHAYVPTDGIGTCYVCIQACTGVTPNTSIVNWQPVGVPEVFSWYIIFWTAAQRMSEEQGKDKIQALAEAEMKRLCSVLLDQTGTRRRMVYRSR